MKRPYKTLHTQGAVLSLALWLSGVLLLGSAAATQTRQVTAAPGSIVRWPGEGIEECSFGRRTFDPLDDACLIPVDLGAQSKLAATRLINGSLQELSIRIDDYPYAEQHIQLQDTSRIHLSEENLKRATEERQRIDALWDQPSARRFRLPLAQPLESPGQQRRFGARRVFNGEPRSPHTGADFSARRGTPVLAVNDGEVRLAEEHFFGGKSIFLDHGDELISMYFHLDEIFVQAGEQVTLGAVIGTVGSTGRATGPHLHLGFRWHGSRIDPAALLGTQAVVTVD